MSLGLITQEHEGLIYVLLAEIVHRFPPIFNGKCTRHYNNNNVTRLNFKKFAMTPNPKIKLPKTKRKWQQ